MRMRRIILSSVACLAVPYFFTLFHERRDFREEVFKHKTRVPDFPKTVFLKNFSFQEKFSGILS
jgi:hypothetical protein